MKRDNITVIYTNLNTVKMAVYKVEMAAAIFIFNTPYFFSGDEMGNHYCQTRMMRAPWLKYSIPRKVQLQYFQNSNKTDHLFMQQMERCK